MSGAEDTVRSGERHMASVFCMTHQGRSGGPIQPEPRNCNPTLLPEGGAGEGAGPLGKSHSGGLDSGSLASSTRG